jgi:dipeptidase E
MNLNLLLISNSTNPGEDYLGWPRNYIKDFLGRYSVKKIIFVPFAGVTIHYDAYTARVRAVFKELGYKVESVHETDNPIAAVMKAEAIAVGGGNTFQLVKELQRTGLMEAIREKALTGAPYMGWSAGSNVTCPSLRTTNDMPITEPESFNCMGLIPFQINPHYLDAHPANHGGETREQRIEEFIALNQDVYVAGLRESSLLELIDGKLTLKGKNPARLFRYNSTPAEYKPGSDINFLLS